MINTSKKNYINTYRIAIIGGLGHVGLPLGLLFIAKQNLLSRISLLYMRELIPVLIPKHRRSYPYDNYSTRSCPCKPQCLGKFPLL